MQWLANICIARPVFTWVLMLTVGVMGLVAYNSLGVDRFPNIDIPVVTISTRLDGFAPEEVESEITDRIESTVNTISGLDELRSISSDGISQVICSFNLEKNGDVAAQDVRDKISNVMADLPRNVDAPTVRKIDPDASPILSLSVTSQGSVRDTTEIADKTVRRALESVLGVGQVTLVGGQKRQIRLWVAPARLTSFGLTALDVQQALARQNVSTPAGSLEGSASDRGLRVAGKVLSVAAIGDIVVKDAGRTGEPPVRIRDVSTVEDGSEDETSYASKDGQQTVLLTVRKQSGENTIAVVDRVLERVAELDRTLPSGARVQVVRDNSQVIRTSIDAVGEHLVLGAVFAVVVVLVFLGSFKSTVVAALAIPISIVGTFACMYLQGFSLNVLTLLALALSVGIVIDDAIVVLENIFRFVHELGKKPFDAAREATADIGLAVVATTLSLMAVFLPITFMSGIVGRFLRSFGVTMAFAVGVSMLVSFTLTPMLAARWVEEKQAGVGPNWLERAVDAFYRPVEGAYMVLLGWSMRHRGIVLLLCLATLASIVPLGQRVPGSFLPPNDEAQLEVHVRAPEGTSLTETRLVAERIATLARGYQSVSHTVITIGDDEQKLANKATIYLKLTDPKARSETQQDIQRVLRTEVAAKQDKSLRVDVSEVSAIGGGESSAVVQYTLSGPSLEVLGEAMNHVLDKLRAHPAAADVDSNLYAGKPELRVGIERERAAALGVSVSDLASTLQLLVAGLKVSEYAEGGETFEIRMRAPLEARSDKRALGFLRVPSRTTGQSVALTDVVTLEDDEGPSLINRYNRRRQATLFANVAPGHGASEVVGAIERLIADEHLPSSYLAVPVGQSREMAKAGRGFAIAIGTSLIFMYLVLAAQFESWVHPVTILSTLPLTVPFALLSLLLTRQPISIFSGLGLLVLFGVVKKNAILQVDHTNHLRAEGLDRHEAILRANKDRLRPILMTTVAFVAGMLPLVFSKGIGAGQNQATAGIVVGGQTFSLLLTLLATPVIYSVFDDVGRWFSRGKR
jgi:hydrophobe/amphiphile efflux-1 (HAE1) family protein